MILLWRFPIFSTSLCIEINSRIISQRSMTLKYEIKSVAKQSFIINSIWRSCVKMMDLISIIWWIRENQCQVKVRNLAQPCSFLSYISGTCEYQKYKTVARKRWTHFVYFGTSCLCKIKGIYVFSRFRLRNKKIYINKLQIASLYFILNTGKLQVL